ncbi:MAG: argininosuccinate lyase [Deltaproteobacteria bacterium]|nr:argininosuccinate lyase [Deltaproteobacteria bacterium]
MAKRLWDKGQEIDKLVHQFTVGSDPQVDLYLVKWDLIASAAHARVLRKLDILSEDELTRLIGALKEILTSAEQGDFTIPEELEDCHTAIESLLTAKLGETGKKIHTGRSRNDQVLVALRLFLKSSVIGLMEQVLQLAGALEKRIQKDGDLPLPGYTHFQPAMPSSVAMWLQSFHEWCLELLRDGTLLIESIDSNPLGTASGFGVPLELDRDLSTSLLNFKRVQRNPMYVQSSRGRFELKVVRWCSDAASLVEKLACDLMLFTTSEFGFCSLPEALTTGSSIMPQKRNPDVAELMRAGAARIRSFETQVSGIIAKLPSSYHRDYQTTKEPLINTIEAMREILSVAPRCIESVMFNKARLSTAMTDDLYMTYLVYRQVREGKSFRDAYQQTASEIKSGTTDVSKVKEDFNLISSSLKKEFEAALREKVELENLCKKLYQEFSSIANRVGLS